MQVLNHTYELNEFLDSKNIKAVAKKDLPDTNILIEWDDLRNLMWSGNGIVTPRKFVYNVQQIAGIKIRISSLAGHRMICPSFYFSL